MHGKMPCNEPLWFLHMFGINSMKIIKVVKRGKMAIHVKALILTMVDSWVV